jgi:hypothetical protein
MNMLFHEQSMPVYLTSDRNQSVKPCIFVSKGLYFFLSHNPAYHGTSMLTLTECLLPWWEILVTIAQGPDIMRTIFAL